MAVLTNGSLLLAQWRKVANDLGIEVVGPFEAILVSGARVRVPLLVRCFGGAKGMLVLSDYSLVENQTDEIVQAGYGYSVLSEPDAGEEYDRDVFIEMLGDWGWWGPESERPAWLRPVDPEAE